MKTRLQSLFGVVGALTLAGCLGGAGSRTYLLRPASQTPMFPLQNRGLPVLRVEPVQLPDYLDTTELVLRLGENRIESSRSGHWGERLSTGVTEVLLADLARQLPGEWVTSARAGGDTARMLRVRVERFDVWPDGRCLLVASWTVHDGRSRESAVDERATVELAAGGTAAKSDPGVVAAMDETLAMLAARIAASIEPGPPAAEGSLTRGARPRDAESGR